VAQVETDSNSCEGDWHDVRMGRTKVCLAAFVVSVVRGETFEFAVASNVECLSRWQVVLFDMPAGLLFVA
jgi:hypothetical protein